jgi:ABC-type multidrug transport system fused ATPase/permease subunit
VGQVSGAKPLGPLTREVRCENLVLRRADGSLRLDHVSGSLPAGSRLALAATNAETSRALVEVLLRYQDPHEGRVLWDDGDLRLATLDSLRQQTAYCPSQGLLITGTIAENIRCGRAGYSQEQIEQATRQSLALGAIEQLPHGFQTTVGPLGRVLPPGLAFQIELARALLSNPALLVLQEPCDNGDEGFSRLLDQVLQYAAQDRTLVLLPARLAGLRWVQHVWLFHEGRLQGQGAHAELLQHSALYRHLNYVWFNPYRGISHAANSPC